MSIAFPRRASRTGSCLRSSVSRKNSTADKTTAASPLTGWNPVCLSRSAAVSPIEVSNHQMRTRMTLPADLALTNRDSSDTADEFQNPPGVAGTSLIAAALQRKDLTAGAFKVYVAMVVLTEDSDWLTLSIVSRTAGMTPGRARQFIGELVRAGLVFRDQVGVRKDSGPTIIRRYALAVTA